MRTLACFVLIACLAPSLALSEEAARESHTAAVAQPASDAPPAPSTPEPIGLRDFARYPFGTLPTLSPDGTQLAIVYRTDGSRAIIVRNATADADPAPRVLGVIGSRPLWTRWTKDGRVLVSIERFLPRTQLKTTEGEPVAPKPIFRFNPLTRQIEMVGMEVPPQPRLKEIPAGRVTHLLSFNSATGRSRQLGKDWEDPVRFQDDVVGWLPSDPRRILIRTDETERFYTQNAARPSVATMSVVTGNLRTVVQPDRRVQRWFADHDGVVSLGEGDRPDHSSVLYKREGRKLIEIPTYVAELETNVRFAAHSYDPDVIYGWALVQGRQALVSMRLSDQAIAGVFADPKYDVSGPLVFDETQRKLVGVAYVGDTPMLHALDPSLVNERERMARALPGVVLETISESDDKNLALLRASSDVRAPAYYVYDRTKKTMRLELLEYPRLEDEVLQPMTAVRYFARDGLEIPAYLTHPAGNAANAPAIVIVHDGPDQRAYRRFDPLVQWLARNGFAVLEPNYRGSSGYGTAMRSAGYGEWGAAMQNDLEDAAAWLVAEGVADPKRIGIYGRGYGGYAALMGALRSGSPFRASASHGGPTDLAALLEDDKHERVEPDWSFSVTGAHKPKKEQLAQLSPISHVAAIDRPLLLLHSQRDERVRVEQSEEFARLAKKAGKPVELVVFADELYELAREKNRVLWFEKLTAFFQQSLAPEPPPAPEAAPPPAASQSRATKRAGSVSQELARS